MDHILKHTLSAISFILKCNKFQVPFCSREIYLMVFFGMKKQLVYLKKQFFYAKNIDEKFLNIIMLKIFASLETLTFLKSILLFVQGVY